MIPIDPNEIPGYCEETEYAASEQDRIWFETHPDRRTRVRTSYPGEHFGEGIAVAVVVLVPGLRFRIPLGRFPPDLLAASETELIAWVRAAIPEPYRKLLKEGMH